MLWSILVKSHKSSIRLKLVFIWKYNSKLKWNKWWAPAGPLWPKRGLAGTGNGLMNKNDCGLGFMWQPACWWLGTSNHRCNSVFQKLWYYHIQDDRGRRHNWLMLVHIRLEQWGRGKILASHRPVGVQDCGSERFPFFWTPVKKKTVLILTSRSVLDVLIV